MWDSTILLGVIVAAHAVIASPVKARSPYIVKESHDVPKKWEVKGVAPSDHMLHLKIGLKQDRFEELEKHLHEGMPTLAFSYSMPNLHTVSDPDHKRYGSHLSFDHVQELVKPSEETLELVHEWLSQNGVSDLNYSPAKDWINVYIDVDSAERLLETKYSIFEHEDGSQLIRAPKWSLPAHLHDLVDTIQPTTSFMRSKPASKDSIQFKEPWIPPTYKPPTSGPVSKVCKFFPVTIECFRTLYGTLNYVPRVPGKNKIGFNNFLGQIPVRPDIFKFLKKYRPEAAPNAYTFKSIEIDGGPAAQYRPVTVAEANGDDNYREANLDAQTILGMTYPEPVYSYSTGGQPPFNPDINTPENTNEPYLTWVNFALAQKDLPQVITTSYGDDEQTIPKSYAVRVCKEFAQLGARGVSLLVSSGDGGVGGEDADACVTNDGKNTTTFLPAFPAGCPYVTTIGATQQFQPEVSAYRPAGIGPDGKNHGFYASGSGFSSYFARPAWQNAVVPAYIKSLKGLNDGLYNKSM